MARLWWHAAMRERMVVGFAVLLGAVALALVLPLSFGPPLVLVLVLTIGGLVAVMAWRSVVSAVLIAGAAVAATGVIASRRAVFWSSLAGVIGIPFGVELIPLRAASPRVLWAFRWRWGC